MVFMNLETAQMLRQAGPWGQHFPEPCFQGEFEIIHKRLVGGEHLKMVVSPQGEKSAAIDAIAFRVDPKQWAESTAKLVRMVYKLDVNTYRGRQSVQLLVEHIEIVR